MRTIALAATALFLAVTSGCGERERGQLGSAVDSAVTPATDPVQETGGAGEGPGTFGFDQRQEFAQSVRAQLADLDRQIEELTAQAKSTGGSVSDRALANIRASRRSLDRSLGRVDNATADNWEEIRGAVTRGVESLTEALEAAYPK